MNPIKILRSGLVMLPFCLGALGAPNRPIDAQNALKELAAENEVAAAAAPIKAGNTLEGSPSEEIINKKMEEVMGLASEFQKAPVVKKMARFLLDFGGNDLNSGYTTSDGTSNLFNLDIDSADVMEGLFKPENVAVHVGQNAVNFIASTIGWLIAGSLYQTTNSGRSLYASGADSYSSGGYGSPSSSSSGYSTSKAASSYSAPSTYGAPLLPTHKSAHATPFDLITKTLTASSSFFNPFGGGSSSSSNKNQRPRYTPPSLSSSPSLSSYGARKVTLADEPASIEEDIDSLSVDEIQSMLEAQENGRPTMLDRLSDAQKVKVYKKVQSAIGARRKGLAQQESEKTRVTKKAVKATTVTSAAAGKYATQPSITFADTAREEAYTERTNLVVPEAKQYGTSLTVGERVTPSVPVGVTVGSTNATPIRRRRRKHPKSRVPKKVDA